MTPGILLDFTDSEVSGPLYQWNDIIEHPIVADETQPENYQLRSVIRDEDLMSGLAHHSHQDNTTLTDHHGQDHAIDMLEKPD